MLDTNLSERELKIFRVPLEIILEGQRKMWREE